MKESYEKGLANRSAPNSTLAMVTSRVWHGQGEHTGQPLSSEITLFACRPCSEVGKATSPASLLGKTRVDAAESETLRMCGNSSRENREIPSASKSIDLERSANVTDGNADVYADGKSDDSIVPAKRANKTRTLVAELAEERGSPKGNMYQKVWPRTQCLLRPVNQLVRVRQVGRMRIHPTVIPKGGAV